MELISHQSFSDLINIFKRKDLIKMSNYIVKVKKIKTTEMIVEAENGEQAIINVNELISKCEENNIDINASFNSKPVYKYSVSKLEDDEYE